MMSVWHVPCLGHHRAGMHNARRQVWGSSPSITKDPIFPGLGDEQLGHLNPRHLNANAIRQFLSLPGVMHSNLDSWKSLLRGVPTLVRTILLGDLGPKGRVRIDQKVWFLMRDKRLTA